MIYNIENTIEAGRPVKHVFDANGLEYKDCIEVNTETGRIVCQRKETYPMNHLVTEEIMAAQPLLVIFKK